MKIRCLPILLCFGLTGCGVEQVELPTTITPATSIQASDENATVDEFIVSDTEINFDFGNFSSFYEVENDKVISRYDIDGTEKEEVIQEEKETEIVFIFEDSNYKVSAQEEIVQESTEMVEEDKSKGITVNNSGISELDSITLSIEEPSIRFYGESAGGTEYSVVCGNETIWDSGELRRGESLVWYGYEELDAGEYAVTFICVGDGQSINKDVSIKVEK